MKLLIGHTETPAPPEITEIWERVVYRGNEAIAWLVSYNQGRTWRQRNTEAFPDRKPPFVIVDIPLDNPESLA